MRESRPRPRSIAVLVFVAIVAIAGMMAPTPAGARLSAVRAKECFYASQVYSMGACHGLQRCVRGVNNEDYWQDDASCDGISPGGGGRRQV